MRRLIVILGGVRSGKSSFAQTLALKLGERDVTYIATGEAGDEEMSQRIARHRFERPEAWQTLETPRAPGQIIDDLEPKTRVVLLDCLSMWISNILLDAGETTPFAEIERQMRAEIEEFVDAVEQSGYLFVVVSGEVGLGVVPESLLGRQFRDLHGWANQRLVEVADQSYLMVAGKPVNLDSIARTIDECVKECQQ